MRNLRIGFPSPSTRLAPARFEALRLDDRREADALRLAEADRFEDAEADRLAEPPLFEAERRVADRREDDADALRFEDAEAEALRFADALRRAVDAPPDFRDAAERRFDAAADALRFADADRRFDEAPPSAE